MRCNSCGDIHKGIECGYHFCINAAVPACPTCKRGVMNRLGEGFQKIPVGTLWVVGAERTEDV